MKNISLDLLAVLVSSTLWWCTSLAFTVSVGLTVVPVAASSSIGLELEAGLVSYNICSTGLAVAAVGSAAIVDGPVSSSQQRL